MLKDVVDVLGAYDNGDGEKQWLMVVDELNPDI